MALLSKNYAPPHLQRSTDAYLATVPEMLSNTVTDEEYATARTALATRLLEPDRTLAEVSNWTKRSLSTNLVCTDYYLASLVVNASLDTVIREEYTVRTALSKRLLEPDRTLAEVAHQITIFKDGLTIFEDGLQA